MPHLNVGNSLYIESLSRSLTYFNIIQLNQEPFQQNPTWTIVNPKWGISYQVSTHLISSADKQINITQKIA